MTPGRLAYPVRCGNRCAKILPGFNRIRFAGGVLMSMATRLTSIRLCLGSGASTPYSSRQFFFLAILGVKVFGKCWWTIHFVHLSPQLHSHRFDAVLSPHLLHMMFEKCPNLFRNLKLLTSNDLEHFGQLISWSLTHASAASLSWVLGLSVQISRSPVYFPGSTAMR